MKIEKEDPSKTIFKVAFLLGFILYGLAISFYSLIQDNLMYKVAGTVSALTFSVGLILLIFIVWVYRDL